jgi:hypothetical protein
LRTSDLFYSDETHKYSFMTNHGAVDLEGWLFRSLSLPCDTANRFSAKNIYSVNLVELWDLIPRYAQRENWISRLIYIDDSANMNPKACDNEILCSAKPRPCWTGCPMFFTRGNAVVSTQSGSVWEEQGSLLAACEFFLDFPLPDFRN